MINVNCGHKKKVSTPQHLTCAARLVKRVVSGWTLTSAFFKLKVVKVLLELATFIRCLLIDFGVKTLTAEQMDKMKLPPFPEKRLKLYTMELYYSQDVEQLEQIVQSRGGSWQGFIRIDFMNDWNEPVSKQYHCVYYAFEEIHMSIMI